MTVETSTSADYGTTPRQLARIAGFVWGIADDVLRDLYVRGKYRDVILPMTVLRRFDAVFEPTKQKVPETKGVPRKGGIVDPNRAAPERAPRRRGFEYRRNRRLRMEVLALVVRE